MTDTPPLMHSPSAPVLGPRAHAAYRRLSSELTAMRSALAAGKVTGGVSIGTLGALNGAINLANRLFRRHADLPRFFHVDVGHPMTVVDFSILVARLSEALRRFETDMLPGCDDEFDD